MNNLKNIILELQQERDWWQTVSAQESRDEDAVHDQTMAKGIQKAIEKLEAWQRGLKEKRNHLDNGPYSSDDGIAAEVYTLNEILGEKE